MLCTFPLEAHAAHAVQGSCTFYGYHSMVKDHYILSTMCDLLSEWPLMDQLENFLQNLWIWEHSYYPTVWVIPQYPDMLDWVGWVIKSDMSGRVSQNCTIFGKVITPGISGGVSQDSTSTSNGWLIHPHFSGGESRDHYLQFTSDISGEVSQDHTLYAVYI